MDDRKKEENMNNSNSGKVYKVYVRGHGGEENQFLPPGENIAIDMITVGQMGCTMSDEVADRLIFRHYGIDKIKQEIEDQTLIYWTKEQRNDYYENGDLDYTMPQMVITPYSTITVNLALDGAADIEGDCGVCYWNEARGELSWVIILANDETVYLSKILDTLRRMLENDDRIELYWTACMSAKYWSGKNKKVSMNPTKNTTKKGV
jgi:hypothetical protein